MYNVPGSIPTLVNLIGSLVLASRPAVPPNVVEKMFNWTSFAFVGIFIGKMYKVNLRINFSLFNHPFKKLAQSSIISIDKDILKRLAESREILKG